MTEKITPFSLNPPRKTTYVLGDSNNQTVEFPNLQQAQIVTYALLHCMQSLPNDSAYTVKDWIGADLIGSFQPGLYREKITIYQKQYYPSSIQSKALIKALQLEDQLQDNDSQLHTLLQTIQQWMNEHAFQPCQIEYQYIDTCRITDIKSENFTDDLEKTLQVLKQLPNNQYIDSLINYFSIRQTGCPICFDS